MLEFPAIVERLVAVAASEPGRAEAAALVPSPDPVEVVRRQRLTGEAIGLLDAGAEPVLTRVEEIRPAVAFAARGGALQPDALHAFAVAARR
jgi:dsDNA-specific endonuclease/ATPase MutS2